jgi:hypothetical protein
MKIFLLAALLPLSARPRSGKDYRYQPPQDRNDGIAVGDLRDSGIGIAAGEAIVRGILDAASCWAICWRCAPAWPATTTTQNPRATSS